MPPTLVAVPEHPLSKPVTDPPVTTSQPLLDRWGGEALRYACALVPMLFFAAILVWVVLRTPDRWSSALLDLTLSLVGLVLLRWRRRWPWQIAVVTALLIVPSSMAIGPAFVAYVSLCTHRQWRQIIPVAVLFELCLLAQYSWYGFDQRTLIGQTTGTAALAGLTVLGLLVRSRRELTVAEEERALQAQRAHEQTIEQAQLAERAKIAREMHDVLAHRISLLTMLAGGLAHRTDLSAAETRTTALAIQENAHQSLTELRAVLGGLRTGGPPEAPQPTLDQLDALFDEVRAAGQQVEVIDSVADKQRLPSQSGRHAYRIVQEALTNARKHAPSSVVTVELSGRPGKGLRITARNPDPQLVPPAGSGGMGLVGLGERTRMAGGGLRYGSEGGHFALEADLPWEAES